MKQEHAEEYTQALGQVVAGGWRQIALGERLGVPKALGLTTRDWVENRLGGYVRLSVEERHGAVKELEAEGLSQRKIADVLGVSQKTVDRDTSESKDSIVDAKPSKQAPNGNGSESNVSPVDAVAALAVGEVRDKELRRAERNQSVTYKNQPAIDATGGSVPLEGTSHLYRVEKLLWPDDVESVLESLLLPRSLHVCCGMSKLGDVRLDLDDAHKPDILADAADMPVGDGEYESVICDPPYNGEFQWNHDLLDELARVASRRIIFQHWFIPANPDGRYKKAQDKFSLSSLYVWQPKTYFGRAQLISVFDAL